VEPPHLPRSLIAALAGAQQAVITALALLHAGGGVTQVALSEAARLFHEPIAYELTRPGDFLGGAHAGYNVYQTADGYIALAALELYFWPALFDIFPGLPENPLDDEAHRILTEGFRQRPTAFWVAEARARDIPLEPIT
jgi:crotonobetainyl-CoA:carnitine CoA-transferase CaiB-like acyl-CoA transferase